MRVALITDGIWPYVLGGMQKHSFYLCKYFAQNRVEVELFHFNQSNYDISKLEFFSEEELKYIRATVIDFPKSIAFPGHYLYNSYKYSKLIYGVIKNQLQRYDFIYTKGFAGWYLIEQRFKLKLTCASIGLKFHGYEMFQKAPDFKTKMQHLFLLRRPARALSKKADVVFSYGGKITDIISSIGVDTQKIFEMPSGVEKSTLASTIQNSSNTRRFLFLGRYERRKGIEELNEAIRLILMENGLKNYEFQFIGPIPIEKRLKLKQVIYHGEIRSKELLQQLMRKCDVLICPSWSEGMPNVILEAMANGLAVIATDVGATNVLVSEKTGWLIKSGDPSEITKAIQLAAALNASELDLKKVNALNLLREQFNWERLAAKLIAFIQSLPKK